MKKIGIVLIISMVMLGCGATSPEMLGARKILKGNWILNSVTFDNEGVYEINVLNGIPAKCIEQSRWKFIDNNNTGHFQITNESCAARLFQNFIWVMPKEKKGDFYTILIKPVDEKQRSDMNNKGYRMALEQLNSETMTWSSITIVNDEIFKLKFNFTRSYINPK